jgi:hypothetical protein
MWGCKRRWLRYSLCGTWNLEVGNDKKFDSKGANDSSLSLLFKNIPPKYTSSPVTVVNLAYVILKTSSEGETSNPPIATFLGPHTCTPDFDRVRWN